MSDFVELRRVIEVVLRKWWLVVLLTSLGGAAGMVVSQRQQPVYRATTSVIVGQAILATNLDTRDIQTSEQLALTYADIARRQPVLAAVVETLGMSGSWQDLRRRVTVRQVPETQLLEIAVEADSRAEATAIAAEISRQLIRLSPTALQDQADNSRTLFVEQRLQELQANIEAGQRQLNALNQTLGEDPSPERRVEIQAEITQLEELIFGWEAAYARYLSFVGNDQSANYIAVVDEATAERFPVRPNLRLNVLGAAAVGFALAVAIIFLLDFLDDSLKSVEDIRRHLNLTPLGAVGQLNGRKIHDMIVAAREPFSPLSESYRMLRNNIRFAPGDEPQRSLLITSPSGGDGKSTTAANLGVVMAADGRRTLLVDADLRRPVLHEAFKVPNEDGLTNMIACPDATFDGVLRPTGTDGLRLLTSGKLTPAPSELLDSPPMAKLVSRLTDEADLVIYDSPPAAFFADAIVLARKVDGVILVIGAGRTRRDVAQQAVFNLQQAGVNILGAVLNRAAIDETYYSSYYLAPARTSLIARLLAAFRGRRVREPRITAAAPSRAPAEAAPAPPSATEGEPPATAREASPLKARVNGHRENGQALPAEASEATGTGEAPDEAVAPMVAMEAATPFTREEKALLRGVSGIGPRRTRLLHEYFGSLEAIRQATVEEIAALPGMPLFVARAVKDRLT